MIPSGNTTICIGNACQVDGQIAQAIHGGKAENFLWDDLALVHRGETSFVNEPYVTGGNPILSSKQGIMFNDMLGNTLGTKQEKFNPVQMTAFGETKDTDALFTGKPYIGELGYAFLFRNYRADKGKWLTADPLGYPDGWNNYAYCNNMLNALDPLGLWSLMKWIYTGDGNASDDIYNQCVAAAGETYYNSLNNMFQLFPELGIALNYYGQTQSLVTWTDSSLIVARVSSDPLVTAFVNQFIENTIIKIKNVKTSGSDSTVSDLYVLDTFVTGDLGAALIFGRFYINASANWNVTRQDDEYYSYNISFNFYINDTFDFSTTMQIAFLGLLSLGKPFNINLLWNEYRAGVFE